MGLRPAQCVLLGTLGMSYGAIIVSLEHSRKFLDAGKINICFYIHG